MKKSLLIQVNAQMGCVALRIQQLIKAKRNKLERYILENEVIEIYKAMDILDDLVMTNHTEKSEEVSINILKQTMFRLEEIKDSFITADLVALDFTIRWLERLERDGDIWVDCETEEDFIMIDDE